MKALFILMLLASTSFAQNYYYGTIYGAKVYFFDDGRGYFGRYTYNGDHSPGAIYIANDLPTSLLIQTLTHEICHLKQDLERRQQNEDECYCKAQRICQKQR